MPRNPEISKKEKRSLRSGLFGGMGKRELEQVKQCARERQTPYSCEGRMVDAACFASLTLGQYWPPTDDRELEMQLTIVLHRSVDTAKADDAKLRQQEVDCWHHTPCCTPGRVPGRTQILGKHPVCGCNFLFDASQVPASS